MESTTLPKTYEPLQVEPRWYRFWKEGGFFRAVPDPSRPAWAVMMPLPNVTGELHIGHALNNTLQDVLTRFYRMRGYNALYQPGTDHAGIATQNVVERWLARQEGLTREDLGREGFLERVWQWVEKYGGIIYGQLERLGASCDWERKKFTLDPDYYDAVLEAFVRLYEKGRIYRGKHMVNWCPRCRTTISDLEVEYEPKQAELYYVRYAAADGSGDALWVATIRPETIPADVAVAVSPEDARYRSWIGRELIVPLGGRRVPVIADRRVDPSFGTGALKITPGHDPLDNEIGREHGLESLVVIDEQGRMLPEAGPELAGLDRFEARKRAVELLRARGALWRQEPYQTNVGTCDRCHTVIEPYLSEQWFCDVSEMAARTAEAIRTGRVRFYPERWARVALEWLAGIRPWVISRQLWWGHRIPIYTCLACGHRMVQKHPPARCARCGASDCEQDPDVLDTWFSSALWPLATLGWPHEREELRYFYPTSVLVTGRDILFLWVCRMIMFGLEFRGEVPFREVYINPTVMDLQGRRMSKSLGTGVDPMEAINKYGADALRLGLLARCSQTQQDLRFDEKMIADMRTFANKIWNAFRFLALHMEEGRLYRRERSFAELELVERWMLDRLNRRIPELTRALEEYRFNEAVHLLYELIWNDYCDWYLELIKPRSFEPMEPDRLALAIEIFESLMALLHPFMPFVTEEVWQRLRVRSAGEALIRASWPEARAEETDAEAARRFAQLQELISALRALRAEMGLAPKAAISLYVRTRADAVFAEVLRQHRSYLERLAGAQLLDVGPEVRRPPESALLVLRRSGGHEAYVPLSGLVDLRAEQERIQKEILRLEGLLAQAKAKLANADFLSKAPAEVVERERQKAASLQEALERLRTAYAQLS
ncbi:MAG: valine--tRNA ligase [Bacteroidota bacterium]|nr:valine--tRNA ligase [Bacteroidota bacterium]